jgi:hypothetical protein
VAWGVCGVRCCGWVVGRQVVKTAATLQITSHPQHCTTTRYHHPLPPQHPRTCGSMGRPVMELMSGACTWNTVWWKSVLREAVAESGSVQSVFDDSAAWQHCCGLLLLLSTASPLSLSPQLSRHTCVRVGACPCAQQALTPLGAQESHVLHQVSHALVCGWVGWVWKGRVGCVCQQEACPKKQERCWVHGNGNRLTLRTRAYHVRVEWWGVSRHARAGHQQLARSGMR